jgi:transcriptional regulator with XRE-family HTH domain
MSAERLLTTTRAESAGTISARQQLLQSFRDREYRHAFVNERLRSSVALQIRALREARTMTQTQLGEAIGMAQTWVSKLENPEYGRMTVATLLRLAEAFDTDLEIKFRPFSRTLDSLPTQGPEYFLVPSFDEEFGSEELTIEDQEKIKAIEERLNPAPQRAAIVGALSFTEGQPTRRPTAMAASASGDQEQYGGNQSPVGQNNLAIRYTGTQS